MIGAFKILGEAIVNHLQLGSYNMTVTIRRTHEPTSRIEEMTDATVDVFSVSKSTSVEERKGAYRTIAIGVGIRRQIEAAVDSDVLFEQDQLLELSDRVEEQMVRIGEYLSEQKISASFLGINIDDERAAFFREMMSRYDTYDDELLLTFQAVFD